MRVPFPRRQFRIRSLLLLIALAALILAGVASRKRQRFWRPTPENRRRNLLSNAAMYGRFEAAYLKAFAKGETRTIGYKTPQGWATFQLQGIELKRMTEENGRLRRKYEYAAAHPRLRIQSEPSLIGKLIAEKGLVRTPVVPPAPLPSASKDGATSP
jgi:hypothetical protein